MIQDFFSVKVVFAKTFNLFSQKSSIQEVFIY